MRRFSPRRIGRHHPTTEALVDWYRTRGFYDHWLVGAAGLNIGLESQVVGIMEPLTPPLTEKYGFTNDKIGYFEVHNALALHGWDLPYICE